MNDTSMPVASFTIEVTPRDRDTLVVVSGSLDQSGAPDLSERLEAILQSSDDSVQLDVGGVTFISSAGVGSLVSSVGSFREAGRDITLVNASVETLHVLELLGLLAYLRLDEQE